MKKPKIRELGEAIKALIKGPYTTKFPFKPAEIAPEYRGFPRFQDEDCVRCGGCAEVCPTHTIERRDLPDKSKRVMYRDWANCILCGECALYCLTQKGVVMTNEFDRSTLDRKEINESIEDELVKCECCGEVITTKKHMKWVSDRLGELSYSNPTLVMFCNYELGLAEKDSGKNHEGFWREDQMRILCPNCRRNLVAKEDWGEQ
jgi:hydrogenase-4 component H